MAKSRLHELSEKGQSVWIDSLSREWLRDGTLSGLIDEDAVVGVTSNPTIFQKALSEGGWYDDQLREVLVGEDEPREIFWQLAVRDVQEALDLLRPVWDEGKGLKGYVSLEVDPDLAYDQTATIEQALRLHAWVDRPNLFVKIPATEPGLGAIEECIARGRSINVTLIFSLERHAAVAEAYIRGLERLVESGGDPTGIASVASFFVSRVDTEADKRLDAAGTFVPNLKESSRSPTRSSRTSSTRRCSRASAGSAWRRVARRRSGACGPRPRRRTPSTATSSTSRS